MKELKNLLGKKTTLLELDNYMSNLYLNATSLFEHPEQALKEQGWAYQNNNENVEGAIIHFDIIKKEEDNFNTLVKITKVERL